MDHRVHQSRFVMVKSSILSIPASYATAKSNWFQDLPSAHPLSTTTGHEKPPLLQIALIIILLLSTSAGCVVHIWYMSDIYFAYSTITTISIVNEAETPIPAITLCMPLRNTFNRTKFYQKLGRNMERDEPIPPQLTLTEIYDLGINMDNIIIGVFAQAYMVPNQTIDWRPSYSPTLHAGRNLKCITLFRHPRTIGRRTFLRGSTLQLRLRFFPHTEFVPHAPADMVYRIFVHGAVETINELLYGPSFEISPGRTILINFKNSRSIRLPAPYKTNCFSYGTPGSAYETRVDCISHCLAKRWFENPENAQLWPADMALNLEKKAFNWSTIRLAESHSSAANATMILRCGFSKICLRDNCVQDHARLDLLLDKIEETHAEHNVSNVFIRLSNEPSHLYKHEPKVELIEYVCHLGSVVTLWFGLSVWACLGTIRKMRFKFM